MSVLAGMATGPAGDDVVVAVAVPVAGAAGAASAASLTGALEPVSAPVTSGNSTRAVSNRLSAVAGCCANAVNGASPKQTSATAGTAFQGFLLIQPLTFTQNVESGYE